MHFTRSPPAQSAGEHCALMEHFTGVERRILIETAWQWKGKHYHFLPSPGPLLFFFPPHPPFVLVSSLISPFSSRSHECFSFFRLLLPFSSVPQLEQTHKHLSSHYLPQDVLSYIWKKEKLFLDNWWHFFYLLLFKLAISIKLGSLTSRPHVRSFHESSLFGRWQWWEESEKGATGQSGHLGMKVLEHSCASFCVTFLPK